MNSTTSTFIFNTERPSFQEQSAEPTVSGIPSPKQSVVDWERERNRAFAFFELDWDTIEELPFNLVGDPNVNDRCMAEAMAYCQEHNIEPELWGLAYS
jgi:hypothetical protein